MGNASIVLHLRHQAAQRVVQHDQLLLDTGHGLADAALRYHLLSSTSNKCKGAFNSAVFKTSIVSIELALGW